MNNLTVTFNCFLHYFYRMFFILRFFSLLLHREVLKSLHQVPPYGSTVSYYGLFLWKSTVIGFYNFRQRRDFCIERRFQLPPTPETFLLWGSTVQGRRQRKLVMTHSLSCITLRFFSNWYHLHQVYKSNDITILRHNRLVYYWI